MEVLFDHEKLTVYQRALEVVALLDEVLRSFPRQLAVHNQLDRASTSIVLNIAEGNGKHSPKDRCRFFDIARGSACECAAALDVAVAKQLIGKSDVHHVKSKLRECVAMLVGLIRFTSNDRVHEPPQTYSMETFESVADPAV